MAVESGEVSQSEQVADTGVETNSSGSPGMRETQITVSHPDQVIAAAYDPDLRFDSGLVDVNVHDVPVLEIAQEGNVQVQDLHADRAIRKFAFPDIGIHFSEPPQQRLDGALALVLGGH